MKTYELKLRDVDAPPIVVPSYSVETYFALGEEQAEKQRVRRCIYPELPDGHRVYSAMHSLPESMYRSKEYDRGATIWEIEKSRIEEFADCIGLNKTAYPYREALEMIQGEHFWIIAWDD